MEDAVVNGVTLKYETRGSGEPVVLVHGGLLADENTPLIDQAALTDDHLVVNYHRRGFADSTHTGVPTSIDVQAEDCLALIRELDLGPAHLVGHSLGGAIALQAALAEPDTVRSLTLLEPALMGQIAKAKAQGDPKARESQQQFAQAFEKVLEIARSGDKRAALLAFLESRAGEAFRGVLDFLTESGELDQAVRDADTFLQIEMPAAFGWNFTAADAGRIRQPVLSVLGSHSPQRAHMVHNVLSEWIPQTRLLVLDAAEHALPLMDPAGLASGVAHFLGRYAQQPAPAGV